MREMQTVHSTKPLKIVILGGSGRLGRLVRPFWHNKNAIWHSRKPQERYTTLDIIEDPKGLVGLLANASTVICLAGVTPASVAGSFDQNVALAKACLDAAQAANVGRVFLTSTAAVYGDQTAVLDENCSLRPLSEYAHSKIEMEQMACQHDQVCTTLRIGNVVGADAILGNWHPEMRLEHLPDGTTPKRSYIGPATLSKVIQALVMRDDLPPLLNVAAPHAVHMSALLDHAGLAYQKTSATAETIANVTLNTDLLGQYATFAPEDSLASSMVAEWKKAVSLR